MVQTEPTPDDSAPGTISRPMTGPTGIRGRRTSRKPCADSRCPVSPSRTPAGPVPLIPTPSPAGSDRRSPKAGSDHLRRQRARRRPVVDAGLTEALGDWATRASAGGRPRNSAPTGPKRRPPRCPASSARSRTAAARCAGASAEALGLIGPRPDPGCAGAGAAAADSDPLVRTEVTQALGLIGRTRRAVAQLAQMLRAGMPLSPSGARPLAALAHRPWSRCRARRVLACCGPWRDKDKFGADVESAKRPGDGSDRPALEAVSRV